MREFFQETSGGEREKEREKNEEESQQRHKT